MTKLNQWRIKSKVSTEVRRREGVAKLVEWTRVDGVTAHGQSKGWVEVTSDILPELIGTACDVCGTRRVRFRAYANRNRHVQIVRCCFRCACELLRVRALPPRTASSST